MIKFFFIVFAIFLTIFYIKKRKNDYYFNYEIIDKEKGFVKLNYIYYDEFKNIRKDYMIIPESDVLEIIDILEICFYEEISIK